MTTLTLTFNKKDANNDDFILANALSDAINEDKSIYEKISVITISEKDKVVFSIKADFPETDFLEQLTQQALFNTQST